jgi:hypothetical protein
MMSGAIFKSPAVDGNVCIRYWSGPPRDDEYELVMTQKTALSALSTTGVSCELPEAFLDVGGNVTPRSPSGIDSLLAAGGSVDIEVLRIRLLSEIDTETERIIMHDFEYPAGTSIELTDRDQLNLERRKNRYCGYVNDGATVAEVESAHFPFDLKVNETSNGAPVYKTFTTLQAFKDFSVAVDVWVTETRATGHALQTDVAVASEAQLLSWSDPRV